MNHTTIFGQYIPQESLIHSLNPIIKILVFTSLLSILFTINKALVLIIITIFVVYLMYLTKIKIHEFIKTNSVFIILAIIMSASNFLLKFYLPPNHFNTFSLIASSAILFIRLFLLAMINSIFLFTTSPTDIVQALEFILSPLKYFRINTQEISLAITMSIKFLPIIFEEFNKIVLAQTARGVDFKSKNLFKRIKNYVKITPPLIVFTLRKADNISAAIFSRCYDLNSPRTKFKKIKIQKYDIIFLAISTLTIIGVIICNNLVN